MGGSMKFGIKIFNLTMLFTFFFSLSVFGQVRLPKLISDGMVLQRDANVKIWGWATGNEKITINFNNKTYETRANESGEWAVKLAQLPAGGPFTMTVSSSGNTITINDIVVGDVWVCSGQSNMELNMRRANPIYESEISNSENKFIRHFVVPKEYDFNTPRQDLSYGEWKTADPKNVLDFSAVAYFFARELYAKYQVPIGLINASLGGSPAEAWISEEAVKVFPQYYQEAVRFKDSNLIRQIETQDRTRMQNWYYRLNQKDKGYLDPYKSWHDPDLIISGWATMKIPGYWAETELGAVNGVIWFRKDFNVPVTMAALPAKLLLGRIVDADSVYINGVFVGTTSYQYPPRRYDIPANLLKEGKNIIVVRIISNSGRGGFVPDKPYEIVSAEQKIDLSGDWLYRLGAVMEPLAGETFIRWKPVGLFNAMIAPLLNYRIHGVIWYQGESNAGRAFEYRRLLSTLICDWRNRWGQGDFPFLFVQLPNFMEAGVQPSESDWALFREAQLKTLSLPHTGMAVTIDIGEWNDVHPLNKKDVGKRLALAAQKVAYGDEHVVYSGPVYQSMQIDGNRITLTFKNTGSGLTALGNGELKHFAIAGKDGHFIWAQAKIENDKVLVWSALISDPVAVRYAWADNPEGANLYNKEGLPASPFRTD
jgi:sialate O-acetylesterase